MHNKFINDKFPPRHRSASYMISDKDCKNINENNEEIKNKKLKLRRHQLSLRCSTWLNHYPDKR